MKMWIEDDSYGYSEQIYLLPFWEDLISSPNFDIPICSFLLETLISRFIDPIDSSNMVVLLNLHELGVSLTSLATRGMHGWSRGLLIRYLRILVRPRWPFSSFCTVVETHRDQRHNHNMLGNSETSEGNRNNIPRGRASTQEKKRKSEEQENHFEEQNKRLALNRDSLNLIIQITGHDVIDSTHMGVDQPSLESISTQPLNSTLCFEQAKLNFNNLIQLPLKQLITDPENETNMKKALSILADNLSLFSVEQAEQILELLFDFPALVHSWREYSRCQMYSQKSTAETSEKIRDLLKTSVKDEERLNVRYEELKMKENELMIQLAAVQKEKARIAEERTEKSKQIKDLISSAEEKANKEECLMGIATTKLNNLSHQWAKLQSFFI